MNPPPTARDLPRERIAQECRRRGKGAVVAGCVALLEGRDVDADLVRVLGGAPADWALTSESAGNEYWLRVWAARGLLWAWDDAALPTLLSALDDEAWRVREMALKVVARHRPADAVTAVAERQEDPVARVRAAAFRALVRLEEADAGAGPEPGAAPVRVRLVQLPAEALHALAATDLAAANRAAPVTLTPYFVAPESRSVWARRSRQVVEDPSSEPWITRAIVDADSNAVVGRAGYHGPPDAVGMVEVGYAVDPPYRRRGYARAALVALLDRARDEPAVRTVRATISPDNEASRALVVQYGFVEVGEQWDEEDGLETIFEVAAGDSPG